MEALAWVIGIVGALFLLFQFPRPSLIFVGVGRPAQLHRDPCRGCQSRVDPKTVRCERPPDSAIAPQHLHRTVTIEVASPF